MVKRWIGGRSFKNEIEAVKFMFNRLSPIGKEIATRVGIIYRDGEQVFVKEKYAKEIEKISGRRSVMLYYDLLKMYKEEFPEEFEAKNK